MNTAFLFLKRGKTYAPDASGNPAALHPTSQETIPAGRIDERRYFLLHDDRKPHTRRTQRLPLHMQAATPALSSKTFDVIESLFMLLGEWREAVFVRAFSRWKCSSDCGKQAVAAKA